MAKKLIALDDGHGMETAGKRTPTLPNGEKSKETGKNFMHENEFNRAVVKYLDAHLKRCGFATLLVAPNDSDTSLSARTNLANSKKADLYLSVHANANNGQWGDWGGIETYVYPSGESKRIGNILHKHVMKGTKLRDRGVKDGSHLWVIRKTNMPSVLFELAFMDSKTDYKYLLQDAYRRECAEEIARGVCEAYGVKYVEDKPKDDDSGKGSTIYRVRKSKDDAESQIGAFSVLQSAKDLADKNPGYEVYDQNGKLIYTPNQSSGASSTPKKAAPAPKKEASKPKSSGSIKSVGKIKIVNVNSAAIIMDRPDAKKSKNLGTIGKGKTIEVAGSVKGKNSDSGYWEVIYKGKRAYVTGKMGQMV